MTGISLSGYMPYMTVASLEMSDEPKNIQPRPRANHRKRRRKREKQKKRRAGSTPRTNKRGKRLGL